MHHPHQQQPQPLLTLSMVSSTNTSSGYQIRIPPISQPLISRYRNEKLKVNLFSANNKGLSMNIFTEFFCGKQSTTSVSMCQKCQRSEQMNLCGFVLDMIEQKYDWRNDPKFRSTYDSYNKKKLPIFLTDQQLDHRLSSKFSTLGVVLLQHHKLLLMRILRNYIKHTIYYQQQRILTLENDLYFWFLVGIYYHVGVPKYFDQLESLTRDCVGVHEVIMFWMLVMVMSRLGDCTREKIRSVADMTVQYCQLFYPKECQALISYDITLPSIILEWTTQAMMGYMGIEFIGFYIKSILKQGYQYIQKTIMSYFHSRMAKLDRDEIISYSHHQKQHHQKQYHQKHQNGLYDGGSTQRLMEEAKTAKKEQIMKMLMDGNEEWPSIFFSTNVYELGK